ncbi:MAG TPA: addiction module protein [Bacillota bacterium]|nr:addiction module protein [Bacillota bacterium]
MPSNLEECEALALKLSPQERATLAARLIDSLDALDDTENEHLWVQEAERRYQAYKQGIITARPAEEVLRDARAQIR